MQPCPRQTNEATMQTQLDHKSHWESNGTCSYCGSLSPDQLFKAIEDGCEIGPTDKDYKVYLEGEGSPKVGGACKFYFQHLDGEEQIRFVNLFNLKKIQIGYPGYFYKLPFFHASNRKGGVALCQKKTDRNSPLRLFCIKVACLFIGFGIGAIPYAVLTVEGFYSLGPWLLVVIFPMAFGLILLFYGERDL